MHNPSAFCRCRSERPVFAASSSAIQLSGWFPALISIRLPTIFLTIDVQGIRFDIHHHKRRVAVNVNVHHTLLLMGSRLALHCAKRGKDHSPLIADIAQRAALHASGVGTS